MGAHHHQAGGPSAVRRTDHSERARVVACQAKKRHLAFTKEDNCFTQIADAADLARIADTLSEARTVGRLVQVCERWIYSACLCFALDIQEQERTGFHYAYSVYQVEYSRNLDSLAGTTRRARPLTT